MFANSAVTNLDLLGLDSLPPETGERLLRFPLGYEETALLPLEQITEIIRVNVDEILPVPELPPSVLGICNWRGTMLWLIDLNHLLGYQSLAGQQKELATPMAMIVRDNDRTLGLVVQRVNDIELHELQQLQPAVPGLFSPQQLPFLLGALPGDNGMVLNVTAITQCPLWQIHQGKVS
jgi:positive phototaxis protein PixI